MGGNGRDRLAASAGVDRAVARPDLRTLAFDVHAAVGTMGSKTPRGDGVDHLRYRRHRYCDRSAYAWLRADFRALWGARVLGNGGSLCRGVAARSNAARADRRSRMMFRLAGYWLPCLSDPPLSARPAITRSQTAMADRCG